MFCTFVAHCFHEVILHHIKHCKKTLQKSLHGFCGLTSKCYWGNEFMKRNKLEIIGNNQNIVD